MFRRENRPGGEVQVPRYLSSLSAVDRRNVWTNSTPSGASFGSSR
jgi:hypothetical protein